MRERVVLSTTCSEGKKKWRKEGRRVYSFLRQFYSKNCWIWLHFSGILHSAGEDPGFGLGGGGRKRLCARTHITSAKSYDRGPGPVYGPSIRTGFRLVGPLGRLSCGGGGNIICILFLLWKWACCVFRSNLILRNVESAPPPPPNSSVCFCEHDFLVGDQIKIALNFVVEKTNYFICICASERSERAEPHKHIIFSGLRKWNFFTNYYYCYFEFFIFPSIYLQ